MISGARVMPDAGIETGGVWSEKKRLGRLGPMLRSFPHFCGMLQYVHADTGVRRAMRWTPNQSAYCANRTKADIVVKPRRIYFSSLELARDLWWCLVRPGAHAVCVVQAEKDHKIVRTFSSILNVYIESLSRFVRIPFTRQTTNEWRFGDSSLSILEAGAAEHTAAKTGRGSPASRIHLSEVAAYEYARETFQTLIGALPPRGDTEIVLESTANGASGFFWEECQKAIRGSMGLEGGSGYRLHFYPWYSHLAYRLPLSKGEVIEARDDREERLILKGVCAEAIKWYRNKASIMPDAASMLQEFPDDIDSCFIDADTQYIPTAAIEAAIDPYMPLVEGVAYAGLDIGRHNDRTEIVVVKQDRHGIVYVQERDSCRRTDWDGQLAMIERSYRNWEWRRLAVDATGMGTFPAEWLQKQFGRHKVEPIDFTLQRKSDLATGLYQRIAHKTIRLLSDQEMIRDLKAIRRIISDRGNVTYDAPQSKEGHADSAWALALALHACSPLRQQGGRKDRGFGDFDRAT